MNSKLRVIFSAFKISILYLLEPSKWSSSHSGSSPHSGHTPSHHSSDVSARSFALLVLLPLAEALLFGVLGIEKKFLLDNVYFGKWLRFCHMSWVRVNKHFFENLSLDCETLL